MDCWYGEESQMQKKKIVLFLKTIWKKVKHRESQIFHCKNIAPGGIL